jgi:predicted lipoprotein with Yx(FWY)xxD motif
MRHPPRSGVRWLCALSAAGAVFLAGCSSTASPPTAPTVSGAVTSAASAVAGAAPTAAAAATAVAPTAAAVLTSAATPLAAASATVGAATSGTSGSVVQVTNNAKLGKILADPQGRTLYWYAKDTAGTIACTGNCATTWPPFSTSNASPTLPSGVIGTLAVITRPEGTKQVTYDGQPLYYYAKDTAPGDANGQGVGKLWWVVTPGEVLVTPTPSG